MPLKKNVVFIVGPTAIGKTAFSIKCASRVNGEIISCDSMQVYRGMQVLSQAPGPAETKKIRHHLVKFLSPQKEFNVAAFRKKAVRLISNITKRKKTPIVVGGSGLYVKGLVDGLFPSPKADIRFRAKMYDYAARHGSARLYKKLAKVDPAAARLIHPNDARRIVRALEIWHSTGKTMTELKRKTKGLSEKYAIKIFALTAPRERIYFNIDNRVDRMLAGGAVDEVKKLLKKRLSKTAGAVLGLKEISSYLKGEYGLERRPQNQMV
jgi:tRNA dimethylallyltransferase